MTTLTTAFERTYRQIEQRIDAREWLGLQCHVMLGTETVLDIAAGERAAGEPMTTDDRLRWTCSSKIVTAILYARLVDMGLMDLHAPVGGTTPAQLLNHCAGLAEAAEVPFLTPFDAVAQRALSEPRQPDFAVGEQRKYSSFANFAVLAHLAEQATGRSFTELIDTEVLRPSGATATGFTQHARPRDQTVDFRGNRPATWIGDGGTFRDAVGELIPRSSIGAVFPGTGCAGPARDLALLVRTMSPHSARRPDSADEFVRRTAPFSPCLRSGDTAEWGLGFVVGWSRFGRCASPVSFGHAGCRSSLVMHDPRHDLTIAVISNTISTSLTRSERVKPFIPAIYDDLGLG